MPKELTLPQGDVSLDPDKPARKFIVHLTNADMEQVKKALTNRKKTVSTRLENLKRNSNRINTLFEFKILTSVLKKARRIKPVLSYPLEVFDFELQAVVYCLGRSKSKSKDMKQLINWLSECLED
ncbi:MAG: hypothetical protein K2J11_01925 [Oscillospiraceae bacterium]|nr:hypothetical protein [Oscillospiraceae bacterium]